MLIELSKPIAGGFVKSIVAPAIETKKDAFTVNFSAVMSFPSSIIEPTLLELPAYAVNSVAATLIPPLISIEYAICTFFHSAGRSKSISILPVPILHSSTPLSSRDFKASKS